MIARSFSKSFSFGSRPGIISSGDQYWTNVVAMLNYEKASDAWYDPKNLTSWFLGGGTLSNGGQQFTSPLEGTGSMTWSLAASTCTMQYPQAQINGWAVSASGSKYTLETLLRIDTITTTNSISNRIAFLNQGHSINIVKPSGAGSLFHIEANTYYGNAILSSPDLIVGQIYHVALVKDGSKARLFVGGMMVGESTETNTSTSKSILYVERPLNSGYSYTTDATRMTFGVARYWNNFTPPTSFPTNA